MIICLSVLIFLDSTIDGSGSPYWPSLETCFKWLRCPEAEGWAGGPLRVTSILCILGHFEHQVSGESGWQEHHLESRVVPDGGDRGEETGKRYLFYMGFKGNCSKAMHLGLACPCHHESDCFLALYSSEDPGLTSWPPFSESKSLSLA